MRRRANKREGALYRGLPRGPHDLDRSEVARHQRARLQAAMIAAVARNGYARTTIAALVDLAGVSRTTFYQHFDSKQDCFLATHDFIVQNGAEQVARAYRSAVGPRERLRAGFAAFMSIICSEPQAARLVIIEALATGEIAVAHHEQAVQTFERLLGQSFSETGADSRPSEVTLRAIVGGLQRIVYIHLREDRVAELPALVDELLDWTLSYQAQAVTPPRSPYENIPPGTDGASPSLPHLESDSPDSAQARRSLTQRQRILLAVSSLVAQNGYSALTVDAISARAGISNQTLYENFKHKEDAFLAAFDDASKLAMKATSAAFTAAPTIPDGTREAIHALLTYTATHPAYARLAFFEPLAPGTQGQHRAELALQGFVDLLSPAAHRPPDTPSVAEQAIAGAIVSVIQREIAYGRLAQLASLTPSLAYVALAPYIGAAAASRIAQRC